MIIFFLIFPFMILQCLFASQRVNVFHLSIEERQRLFLQGSGTALQKQPKSPEEEKRKLTEDQIIAMTMYVNSPDEPASRNNNHCKIEQAIQQRSAKLSEETKQALSSWLLNN